MDILSFGATVSDFCNSTKDLLRIVGIVLYIFKIAIPIIIIALGMFDFGKAVVAEKEDEIKKQTKRLIYRVIAGIVIFFIPTLVNLIFTTAVPEYESESSDLSICSDCVLKPLSKKSSCK